MWTVHLFCDLADGTLYIWTGKDKLLPMAICKAGYDMLKNGGKSAESKN